MSAAFYKGHKQLLKEFTLEEILPFLGFVKGLTIFFFIFYFFIFFLF